MTCGNFARVSIGYRLGVADRFISSFTAGETEAEIATMDMLANVVRPT